MHLIKSVNSVLALGVKVCQFFVRLFSDLLSFKDQDSSSFASFVLRTSQDLTALMMRYKLPLFDVHVGLPEFIFVANVHVPKICPRFSIF
jgi:hypothetical protein